MTAAVSIRLASADDIEAMSRVLIASIAELCGADHHDDAAMIADWTKNKTPDALRAMLAKPAAQFFVAERAGEIAAVGCIDDGGEIRLNYVAPAHRFQGISKALLGAMESAIKERGLAEAHLTSTTTAHRFYQSAGWLDIGPPKPSYAVWGYPMRKAL